jgi:GT2 family glycosyltransferase
VLGLIRPAAGSRATWVGLLDLDESSSVMGASGPVRADHRQARVLVRVHRAPLGHVGVPILPMETLTERIRTAAAHTLAEALARHDQCDRRGHGAVDPGEWADRMACPRSFPSAGRSGLSIVVCTRDRTEKLGECLRALRQRVSYDPVEILVVDNAPRGDATRELVTAYARDDSRIRYTCEPLPGLTIARNHGLGQARFDLVAFADDDTSVEAGWLAAIAAGFAGDPDVVCVTGPVVSSALDTGAERYFDSRYPWGEAFEPRRYDLGEHRHPSRLYPFRAGIFGTGANFAVRRSAVVRLGGFDPLLGTGTASRGGDDLDMFVRLILAGGRICYLPSALVWHHHRAETGALSEQIYSYGHGLGAYLAKRVMNREMSLGLLRRGLRETGADLKGRMQQASQSSQLGAAARWLALNEALGVAPGALRYYRAARRPANRATRP